MSLVKKGIQLTSICDLTEKGLTQVQDVFTAGDLILIKCFDYELPILIRAGGESWDGVEAPRQAAIKGDIIGFYKV